MQTNEHLQDFILHISTTYGLTPADTDRLIEEFLSHFDETAESFVRRRHHEMQGMGRTNPAIFRAIQKEIPLSRFTAPDLSERQIRRMVYG